MKRSAAYLIGLFLILGTESARAENALPALDESCRLSPTSSCLLAHAHSQATARKLKDVGGLRHIAKIEERMGDTDAAVSTLTDIVDANTGTYTSRDIADLLRLAGSEVTLRSVAKLDADFRQKFGQPQAPSNRALWLRASDLAAAYVMVGNIPAALGLLEQQGRDDEFRSWVATAIFNHIPATDENHPLRLRLADVMSKRERPSASTVLAYLELGELDKAIALTREDGGLILNARRGILEKELDVEAVALIKAMSDSRARESEYQDLAKAFLEKGDKVTAGRVLVAAFADYDLPGRISAAQTVTYRSVKESWRLSSLMSLVYGMARVGIADSAAPSLQAAYSAALATQDPTIRFLLIAPIAVALSKVSDTNEFLEQARDLARKNPKVLAWDCESLTLGAYLGLTHEALAVARSEDSQSFCGLPPTSLEMLVIGALASAGYVDEAEETLFSLPKQNLAPQMLCSGVGGFYAAYLAKGWPDRAVALLDRAPQCKFPFGMAGLVLFSEINTAVKAMLDDMRFEDALRIIRAIPSGFRANYLNIVADGYAAAERPAEALQILEEARSDISDGCRQVDNLLSIALRVAPLSPSKAEQVLKDALDVMADPKNASCGQTMTFANAALVASHIARH